MKKTQTNARVTPLVLLLGAVGLAAALVGTLRAVRNRRRAVLHRMGT